MLLDHWVKLVSLVNLVSMERRDFQDLKVLLERRDCQVLKVKQESGAAQGDQALKVYQVARGLKEKQAVRVRPELAAPQDLPGPQGL